MSIFNQYYQSYHAKGFSVLPVFGKAPPVSKWSKYASEPQPLELLEQWGSQYPNAGIGLACGTQSGVIAIDIDLEISDPVQKTIYEEIQKVLPHSQVVKIGKKGETRFYKFSGETNRKFAIDRRSVLELLAGGNQTVLPPSIHPDINKPYEWVGASLLDVSKEDLPVLGEDTLNKIEAIIIKFKKLNVFKSNSYSRNNGLKDQVVAALGKETY